MAKAKAQNSPDGVTNKGESEPEDDKTIRVVAALDEDAIAAYETNEETKIHLRVRIPRRRWDTKENHQPITFKAAREGAAELLAGLKKNKTVELVAELGKDQNLIARFVRVDRVEYKLADSFQLLPKNT